MAMQGWQSGMRILVLLACCPALTWGQSGEEALRAGLAAARQLVDDGELEQGHDAVLALVDEHGDQDYMLLQIHRIKEILKLSAFWATHERPQAEDLISGDLESYNERSGKIKVSYERDPDAAPADGEGGDGDTQTFRELLELLGVGTSLEASDFQWFGGAPMHPIVFDGGYSVEVSGRITDRDDLLGSLYSNPMVVINAGGEGVYYIYFGYPREQYGFYKTARIVHVLGDKVEELDDNPKTPLEIGEKYTIKVNVSSSTITASANGRTFLKAKKRGKSFGQFGFRGCPKISGLVLNGQANTAWLEGLADAWVQTAWDDFDETYDPLDELSTDLADRVGRAKERPRGLLPEYPGVQFPGNKEYLELFEGFAAKGSFKKILTYMEDLSSKKVSDGFRLFMTAEVQARLGQQAECLATCDKVIEAYPGFAPAYLLRLNMLTALDRREEALAELRALVSAGETDDKSVSALDDRLCVSLAGALVQAGDYEGAREAMRRAIADGVPPAELEGVAFMMTRARFGPEWSTAYEFKSKSYEVRSDLSQKTCSEATKSLEQALSMYERMFGRGEESDDDPDRYLVYIFSGASGYMNYAGDLFGSAPVNTAGVYTPVLKQLLIWNLPDHEGMMRTIRHEGFHQYLDRHVSDAPIWFNEGTAEYFETATLKRGKMTPGAPLMNHVASLTAKGTRWTKLSELVQMSQSEFYADAGLHYAQGWALVHYLLHSGRDEKKMYETYRQALVDGADQKGAAEVAFGGVDWNGLERAVKAHVKGLL